MYLVYGTIVQVWDIRKELENFSSPGFFCVFKTRKNDIWPVNVKANINFKTNQPLKAVYHFWRRRWYMLQGKSLSLICGALTWLKEHEERQRQEVEALLKQTAIERWGFCPDHRRSTREDGCNGPSLPTKKYWLYTVTSDEWRWSWLVEVCLCVSRLMLCFLSEFGVIWELDILNLYRLGRTCVKKMRYFFSEAL